MLGLHTGQTILNLMKVLWIKKTIWVTKWPVKTHTMFVGIEVYIEQPGKFDDEKKT